MGIFMKNSDGTGERRHGHVKEIETVKQNKKSDV